MKGSGHLSAPADVFFFCFFYHALVLEAVSKRDDLPHPVCRYCFPFGRPDGALKATLALQERVGEPSALPTSAVRLKSGFLRTGEGLRVPLHGSAVGGRSRPQVDPPTGGSAHRWICPQVDPSTGGSALRCWIT